MTDARDRIEGLIARTALGDRASFSALYDATSAKLFGIALRVLNDRAAAEDALQEIYVKVWHNAARYQANGLSPITWLATIARNHAVDRLRKARSADRTGLTRGPDGMDLAELVADPAPGPEDLLLAASERARLADCFKTLEPDRAEAVRRAYLDGDTYADLADRYGVPLNTMRSWLRRSLIRLKDCLTQ